MKRMLFGAAVALTLAGTADAQTPRKGGTVRLTAPYGASFNSLDIHATPRTVPVNVTIAPMSVRPAVRLRKTGELGASAASSSVLAMRLSLRQRVSRQLAQPTDLVSRRSRWQRSGVPVWFCPQITGKSSLS